MSRTQKIVYWVATLWLALGMTSTGIVQVIQLEEEVAFIVALGFPAYFVAMLGVCKLLGVVAVLVPKFPLLKEWAYAGFFFTMAGAIASHVIMGDPFTQSLPPLLLLVLTMVSWYFRPASRRLAPAAISS